MFVDRLRHWISEYRSKDDAKGAPGVAFPNSADKTVALGALYQAERQDAASMLVTSWALIAAAFTYLGLAAVLANNVSLPGGEWTFAFLAFPLWVIAAFYVLLVANALVRAQSIEVVENKLSEAIGFDERTRQQIGSRAGQRAANVSQQPMLLKVQTLVGYGGIFLTVIGFTFYCLNRAAKVAGWSSVPVICGEVIYAFLFISQTGAWLHGIRLAGDVAKRR